MTMSRERTLITTDEAGQAQFVTPDVHQEGQSPWLVVTEVRHRARNLPVDQLCVIVEPVERSPRAASVAAGVIAAIRDIYASSEATDPLNALTTAIDAANLALYQQNLSTTPGQRVLLGLTCLVVRGQSLLICQVPPTQLILSQGGTPTALPELVTWTSDYQPHTRDDRQGLGATEVAAPHLFRAALEDGDLLTLCTSNIARQLATPGVNFAPLLDTDPVAAVEFLVGLAEQHGLTAAYATTIIPAITEEIYPADYPADADDDYDTRPGASADTGEDEGWFERNLREMRQRSKIIAWPRFGDRRRRADSDEYADTVEASDNLRDTLEESAADERTISAISLTSEQAQREIDEDADQDDGWDDVPYAEDHAPQPSRQRAGMAFSGAIADFEDRGDPLDELLPSRHRRRANPFQAIGSVIALPLLGVGTIVEKLAPTRGRRRDDRYLDDGHRRVWPIGSLERYQSGGLPFGRVLPLILLVGLVVFIGVLLVSLRNHQARVEQASFDGALAKVTQAREAAIAQPDRQAAHLQLLALPAQLKAIPAADKPGRQDRIADEAVAINAALDQVDGVQRLTPAAVNLLAPLPSVAGGTGPRPQIVVGGGKPYLFYNGTVYLADGKNTPTKILTKGDVVGGTTIGTLLGITWREDSLFAYTETQGLARDKAGTWTATPLAANGRKATAVDSFVGNLYLLETERGQIVKYSAGAYNQSPQPWSTSKVNADLNLAVDFTIDKDIYALLSDGRVLDLYQGEVKSTFTASVIPPLTGAAAIASTIDGKWLYILDAREGRIIRMGRDGTQVSIYKPATDAKTLAGAREIAADEGTNTLYLLTDEGLVSVRLP
jgi:hypothetical protein